MVHSGPVTRYVRHAVPIQNIRKHTSCKTIFNHIFSQYFQYGRRTKFAWKKYEANVASLLIPNANCLKYFSCGFKPYHSFYFLLLQIQIRKRAERVISDWGGKDWERLFRDLFYWRIGDVFKSLIIVSYLCFTNHNNNCVWGSSLNVYQP